MARWTFAYIGFALFLCACKSEESPAAKPNPGPRVSCRMPGKVSPPPLFDTPFSGEIDEDLTNLPHESAPYRIGYIANRTNLPWRGANVVSQRAMIVNGDGTSSFVIAPNLTSTISDTYTEFNTWSPDGKKVLLVRGRDPAENYKNEEQIHSFIFENQLLDGFLVDFERCEYRNLTSVNRVSTFNFAFFFWPGQQNRIGFTGLDENHYSRIHAMDSEGNNVEDLTGNGLSYAYGLSVSPDGRRIAFHRNYKLTVANADGSDANTIDTGLDFNFSPYWSPDGQYLAFTGSPEGSAEVFSVKSDGSNFAKLADRGGYCGAMSFIDVPDFHDGISDVPLWGAGTATSGPWIYYSAYIGDNLEIFRVNLDGRQERLTRSKPGTLNYMPVPSPDGKWVVFGSTRTGVRQLFVMKAEGGGLYQITHVDNGWAALSPIWQTVHASVTPEVTASHCPNFQ